MSTTVKILNLGLLLFLASCGTVLERDQGNYGALIFENAEFSPGQPPLLIKDHTINLWSDGCGFEYLNIENHFTLLRDKYKAVSSQHLVGLADVKIKTYAKLLLITALPCMRIEAKPFIVKSWQRVRKVQP